MKAPLVATRLDPRAGHGAAAQPLLRKFLDVQQLIGLLAVRRNFEQALQKRDTTVRSE